MSTRPDVRIIDVTDAEGFGRLPPCADARFDHRSCDYWEDEVHGSKAARPAWWQSGARPSPSPPRRAGSDNPFAPSAPVADELNPFSPTALAAALDPFAGDDLFATPPDNPFAPVPEARDAVLPDGPRKLLLLDRGRGIFGSYAKVLLVDDAPAVFAQFGPLSAYPRARHIRDLYPQLPDAPLPAVITCIASTASERGTGHAEQLVAAVCEDLAGRGFAAIEAYPDLTLGATEASAAYPAFWIRCGFDLAVDDERYPVLRRTLD